MLKNPDFLKMLQFSEIFEFSSENSWILKEFWPNSDVKSSNGSIPRLSNLSTKVPARVVRPQLPPPGVPVHLFHAKSFYLPPTFSFSRVQKIMQSFTPSLFLTHITLLADVLQILLRFHGSSWFFNPHVCNFFSVNQCRSWKKRKKKLES